MKILCTFPGKFGDLLWALPTIRAISRRVGEPVDLWVAKPFGSITPLLSQQPYLGMVASIDSWEVLDTAPISPRAPAILDALPTRYDAVLNLGYRDWPIPDLAMHTRQTAHLEGKAAGVLDRPLDQSEWSFEPWITLSPGTTDYHWPWVYGFTDEHFELKFGLVSLLEKQYRRAGDWLANPNYRRRLPATHIGSNPRWEQEAGCTGTSWVTSVRLLQQSGCLLACNSALHVLAVACGVPVVMVEPNPMRHNPVFYPLGTDGPRVLLVRGVDGQPTFDARHVRDALESVFARQYHGSGILGSTPSTR